MYWPLRLESESESESGSSSDSELEETESEHDSDEDETPDEDPDEDPDEEPDEDPRPETVAETVAETVLVTVVAKPVEPVEPVAPVAAVEPVVPVVPVAPGVSSTVLIQPFPIDLLRPAVTDHLQADSYGSKTVVIGKAGTGKSTIIKSLLYEKQAIFPVGLVLSGTEDSNGFYGQFFPPSFIVQGYSEPKLKTFIERQKRARRELTNPWALLLIDDCMDEIGVFRTKTQYALYKNGRHFKMLYIVAMQYARDVPPAVRANIDTTFILREASLHNRKILYENYAGIIPTFALFCHIMDTVTVHYTALVIHNTSASNCWQDCVYWYRAVTVPADFRFGCQTFWDYHNGLIT